MFGLGKRFAPEKGILILQCFCSEFDYFSRYIGTRNVLNNNVKYIAMSLPIYQPQFLVKLKLL